jgi:hypothetical protein
MNGETWMVLTYLPEMWAELDWDDDDGWDWWVPGPVRPN